jgi:hypothetical protein
VAGTAANSKEVRETAHGSRIFFWFIWISPLRVTE